MKEQGHMAIGFIVLKPNIDAQQFKEKHPKIYSMVMREKWMIGGCQTDIKEMQECLRMIEISTCVDIHYQENSHSQVLLYLSPIMFRQLKELVLDKNNISSIQVISKMNAPFLWKFWLSSNSMTQLKSMRKCILPSLSDISIDQNPLPEVDLSMVVTPKFHYIWLEHTGQPKTVCQDLGKLLKCDFGEKMNYLYCNGSARIKRTNIIEMFRNILHKINLCTK